MRYERLYNQVWNIYSCSFRLRISQMNSPSYLHSQNTTTNKNSKFWISSCNVYGGGGQFWHFCRFFKIGPLLDFKNVWFWSEEVVMFYWWELTRKTICFPFASVNGKRVTVSQYRNFHCINFQRRKPRKLQATFKYFALFEAIFVDLVPLKFSLSWAIWWLK